MTSSKGLCFSSSLQAFIFQGKILKRWLPFSSEGPEGNRLFRSLYSDFRSGHNIETKFIMLADYLWQDWDRANAAFNAALDLATAINTIYLSVFMDHIYRDQEQEAWHCGDIFSFSVVCSSQCWKREIESEFPDVQDIFEPNGFALLFSIYMVLLRSSIGWGSGIINYY